jgi:hypothetical protein
MQRLHFAMHLDGAQGLHIYHRMNLPEERGTLATTRYYNIFFTEHPFGPLPHKNVPNEY